MITQDCINQVYVFSSWLTNKLGESLLPSVGARFICV